LDKNSQLPKFRLEIQKLLDLPDSDLQVSSDSGTAIVVFSGVQLGSRPGYAWRRRRDWMGKVRGIARRRKIDVVFDFSALEDALRGLESVVIETIEDHFPDSPFKLTIEFNKRNQPLVTVDLGDRQCSADERKELEALVRRSLKEQGEREVERVVLLDGGMQEATDPQLLLLLRVFGPCTKEQLRLELVKREFRIPSIVWVDRRLDRLRQKGFVRYLGSGSFSLSAETLVGTPARVGRSSLDVVRALAMNRRKEW
jgi:hypothetical protein